MCSFLNMTLVYCLGCPPSQDASDHQDYFMFRPGDSYKPSFATITGKGDNPIYCYDQRPKRVGDDGKHNHLRRTFMSYVQSPSSTTTTATATTTKTTTATTTTTTATATATTTTATQHKATYQWGRPSNAYKYDQTWRNIFAFNSAKKYGTLIASGNSCS